MLNARRLAAAAAALLAPAPLAAAQTVAPPFITQIGGPTCSGASVTRNVRITLPGASSAGKIDVFLLFDDTGSFAAEAPQVIESFRRIVTLLQAQVPTADIAFGVGRFEDYGGPGRAFGNENIDGRPFTLNQAILSRSAPTFVADIDAALANTAPGFGGDANETSVNEALFQVATGVGFDGNGNGSTLDSGPAGATSTQVDPGDSGDVPAFSSYVGSGSGTFGGAGFREDSLRIVLLATDVTTVAAFDPSVPIPTEIVATGSTELTAAFAGSGTVGQRRFGFVSDSLTLAGNSVPDAVAPLGAGTIPQSIAAVNAAGIRVIGIAPDGQPFPPMVFATQNPSPMLSALARMTGAVDATGTPLVFDIDNGPNAVALSIVDAVLQLAQLDLDLEVVAEGAPAGLDVSPFPALRPDVGPGESAEFEVTFTPQPGFEGGDFVLRFRDLSSGAAFGSIPVALECLDGCAVVDFESDAGLPLPNGFAIAPGTAYGADFTVDGLSASGHMAAIFDTDPGGPNAGSSDPDLLVGTGNALILQENGALASPGIYADPDDDWQGGTIAFEFAAPVEVCAIDLVDIDLVDVLDATVVMTDSSGLTRTIVVPGGFTEDVSRMSGTGIRRLGLGTLVPQQGFLAVTSAAEEPGFDETRVLTLELGLNGSGAIDNLRYMPAAPPLLKGAPLPAIAKRARR